MLIEIQTRDHLVVHEDVAAAVDTMLRGSILPPEVRFIDESGDIRIEKQSRAHVKQVGGQGYRRQERIVDSTPREKAQPRGWEAGVPLSEQAADDTRRKFTEREAIKVFPYGVARNRLDQAAKRLGVPMVIEKDVSNAQVVVTLRTHYRKRPRSIVDAENRGIPIYVLRSNTINQMERFLSGLFNLSSGEPRSRSEASMLEQTEEAIEAVLNGERWVELSPASSYIRRLQHQMARKANLVSHSYGKEPNRRVRIYRE